MLSLVEVGHAVVPVVSMKTPLGVNHWKNVVSMKTPLGDKNPTIKPMSDNEQMLPSHRCFLISNEVWLQDFINTWRLLNLREKCDLPQ